MDFSDGAAAAMHPQRRLLYTLVTLGMARQEGDDFMLTPRILQLGFAYLSSLSLREVAQPVIETLSRKADEVVAISVLDGADVLYIARAEVTSVLRRGLINGTRASRRAARRRMLGGCVYRKPKHEHIGDAVRPEWRVNK